MRRKGLADYTDADLVERAEADIVRALRQDYPWLSEEQAAAEARGCAALADSPKQPMT